MSTYYKLGQDINFPPVNFAWTTDQTFFGDQQVNRHVDVRGSHAAVIRQIGAASTVMTKNGTEVTSH